MASSGTRTGPVIVVMDPFHPYARRLVDVAYERWGVRTVALVTDPADRLRYEGDGPALSGPAVAGRHRVPRTTVRDLAAALEARYEVAGVVPVHEMQVLPTAQLRQALGLPGSPASTVARFRDKHALKQHLRQQPGAPRINGCALVADPADVRRVLATRRYDRVVLKPNSGTGNSRIGFFDRNASDAALAAYFAQVPDQPVLLEERIDGEEYCVNGQVDACGGVHVQSVFRTHHVAANGRTNLASHFSLVPTTAPVFAPLTSYATAVMRASGLTASPFHMEVIVDDAGPCLVEVAARLAGAGMAFDTGIAHGGALDVFAVALRDYAGLPLVGGDGGDWAAYDARGLWTVCGVHGRRERVDAVDGVRTVQALREFNHWVYAPRIGRLAEVTVDLTTIPWQVTLTGDERRLEEAARFARETLRLNAFRSPWGAAVGRADSYAARAGRLARAGRAALREPTTTLHASGSAATPGTLACTTS